MSLESQFPTRAVTLSDGSSGLRGSLHVEIQEPATGVQHPDLTLDFISSDETLDRYNEIISASGWQLANYQRNPVFQNAHQYGDILFTLGRALITELRQVAERQVLYQRIQFATEANPFARIAYSLYKGKFLTAVSVGFVPLRWENGTEKSPYRRKYLEQELLEVSAVAIPANPSALALAYKSGALEKSDLRETADLLRHMVSDARAESLLTLARDLRALLRHT